VTRRTHRRLSDSEIAALEDLRANASSGIFSVTGELGGPDALIDVTGDDLAPGLANIICDTSESKRPEADAAYICALLNQAPALIAEVPLLRDMLRQARELLERCLPYFEDPDIICHDPDEITSLRDGTIAVLKSTSTPQSKSDTIPP